MYRCGVGHCLRFQPDGAIARGPDHGRRCQGSNNDGNEAYAFFDAAFRPVGDWNRGSIYLWVYELDGTCFFNAVNRSLEMQNLWELEDKNGVKVIQALIAAATSGGGYVDYLWENPAVTGDEEDGSRKVGYAVLLNTGPDRFMIGSGIYPATD